MYTLRKAVLARIGTMEIFDKVHRAIKEIENQEDFHQITGMINCSIGKYNMTTIWYSVHHMPEDEDVDFEETL